MFILANKIKYNNKGFTLIELLVVIAIIGILSTLAVIALGNARAKARDSRRVADIKQISTALELYYADNNNYPTIITPGQSLTSPDGKVYISKIPNNPTPRNDGNCANNDYTYASTPDNTNYTLNFCLGSAVSSTPAGINSASSSGVGTAPGLVGWWKFDEISGTTTNDSSGGNNNVSLYSGGIMPTLVSGKSNKALFFNPPDLSNPPYSFLTTSSNASLRPDNITVSLWANSNTVGSPTGWNGIAACDGGYSYGWRLGYGLAGVGTNVYVQMNFGDNSGNPQGISSNAFVMNSWNHIVFSYDHHFFRLYVNGIEASPLVETNNINWYTSSSTLDIGRAQWNFIGLIDDVRIYNRALSADEVSALYNATK